MRSCDRNTAVMKMLLSHPNINVNVADKVLQRMFLSYTQSYFWYNATCIVLYFRMEKRLLRSPMLMERIIILSCCWHMPVLKSTKRIR